MSHKEEAVRVINLPMGGDMVMEAEVYALTHAVLALVEAQEAANEQARIGNLIAYRAGILTAPLMRLVNTEIEHALGLPIIEPETGIGGAE